MQKRCADCQLTECKGRQLTECMGCGAFICEQCMVLCFLCGVKDYCGHLGCEGAAQCGSCEQWVCRDCDDGDQIFPGVDHLISYCQVCEQMVCFECDGSIRDCARCNKTHCAQCECRRRPLKRLRGVNVAGYA